MKTRVLIVDDRPTNLRIYSQFVSLMGSDHEAICFNDPAEALDWLEDNATDLLVVDYRMPKMNGAEFIKKVREKHSGNEVPAIIITAHQDRECRLSALDAGATDFLQSPVSHVEFRKRAEALLNQRKSSDNLQKRATQFERKQLDGSPQQSSKTMLEQIIDTIPIMINATDKAGKCLFTNAYQAALYDRDPEALVGSDISSLMDDDRAALEKERDMQVLKTQEPIPHYEEKIESNGVELIFHCNKSPLRNLEGQSIGVLTTAVDITARKFAEEHRTHLALHDMLTGLPNRILLAEKVRNTVDQCKKSSSVSALLLLDLDRFKVINDTRGHHSGDALLREVAERIVSTIRANDFAARIGGDEFAIILNDVENEGAINSRCVQILRAINEPYSISGTDQVIGASIGVSIIPTDGEDYDELLRLSDLAMYQAKASGRNCHCFFSETMNQIAQADAKLENELREALQFDQFALHYQPIVDTNTLKYVGLEALLRWEHPVQGLLMPASFIRVAEDTGLMDDIGKWVIKEVCRQISVSEKEGVILPRVALNISPRQFQNQDVGAEIFENIERYGIDHSRIAIEITEELLFDNSGRAGKMLDKLCESGIGISIDDFGTGYSSLQYLRDLPATCLKIDRTFIARIEKSAADRAIIGTISHLAHALGMKVIAEGVENKSQLALLKASGCDEVQGFDIAMPLSADNLKEMIEQNLSETQQASEG